MFYNREKYYEEKIAAVILIVVLAVGLGAGYWDYNNSKENEKPTTTTQAANGEPVTVPAEYNEYYQKNNDFVGWIKIDETPVDYPVVQTDDNEYYLTHNFDKEYESRGCIYMDCDSSATLEYTNTVIYGHNWLDDTVFSPLVEYSDIDFYKEHPIVEYNTRTEMHKWKIFAVIITTASPSEDNGYVFNYIYPNVGGANFEGFMQEINKRTLFNTGVDVNSSDKILTLSTCTREVDTKDYRADCRIVILARMVREGESATVDVSKVQKNPNPKYPQIWYDLKGLENPYKDDEKWYPYVTE